MLSFGLFLPLVADLERSGVASPAFLGLLAAAFPLAEGLAGLAYPPLVRRFGSRAPLLIGQALCAVGYLSFFFSDHLAVLAVGRLVGGVGGASLVVAQHLVAATADGHVKVQRLGRLGAATGLGFMLGLCLTGVAGAALGPELGVKVSSAAALLLCAAVLAGVWVLPQGAAPSAPTSVIGKPLPSSGYLAAYGLSTFFYIGLSLLVSLWAGRTAAVGATGSSAVFVLLALCGMLTQSQIAGPAVRRLGHAGAVSGSFALAALGAVAFALSVPLLAAAAALVVSRVAVAVIQPAALGKLLEQAGTDAPSRAGWAMFVASIGSWSGPLLTGVVAEKVSPGAAALLLAAAALAGGGLTGLSVLRDRRHRTSGAALAGASNILQEP